MEEEDEKVDDVVVSVKLYCCWFGQQLDPNPHSQTRMKHVVGGGLISVFIGGKVVEGVNICVFIGGLGQCSLVYISV